MKAKRKKKAAASEPSKRARARKWGNQFSKKYTDEEIELIGEELLEWFGEANNIWMKDFAISRMIGAARISEFSARNEYFAYLLGIAKEMQESKLVRLGLSKKFNPSMPIFALKNVAGWRDVQDMNLNASVKVITDSI